MGQENKHLFMIVGSLIATIRLLTSSAYLQYQSNNVNVNLEHQCLIWDTTYLGTLQTVNLQTN